MTDQAPPEAATPATPADNQAQLNILTSDKGWIDRFLNGDTAAMNEFHTLVGAGEGGGGSPDDIVASVMAGKAPEFGNSTERQMAVTVEHFRELGISEGATKQFLSGQQVSPLEYQMVANLKRQLLHDPEFVSSFLGGNVEANRKMTTINAVLVNGVKVETAK